MNGKTVRKVENLRPPQKEIIAKAINGYAKNILNYSIKIGIILRECLKKKLSFFLKSDLTWHRPTQKFGSSDNFFNILWNNALSDKFNLFEKEKIINNLKNINLSEKDKDAFRILGLEFNADWPIIQKKFKTLVKKFHPDRNSGSKKFEDKLKKVTLAYSHLKLIMIRK